MKKLALVVLLMAVGFVGYSQSSNSVERIIHGVWADAAGDEMFEFDGNGKVVYQVYTIDINRTSRNWEAYAGTYSIDGRKIKIEYTAKQNEYTRETQSVSTKAELEMHFDITPQSLSNGRRHFLRISH